MSSEPKLVDRAVGLYFAAHDQDGTPPIQPSRDHTGYDGEVVTVRDDARRVLAVYLAEGGESLALAGEFARKVVGDKLVPITY